MAKYWPIEWLLIRPIFARPCQCILRNATKLELILTTGQLFVAKGMINNRKCSTATNDNLMKLFGGLATFDRTLVNEWQATHKQKTKPYPKKETSAQQYKDRVRKSHR